ncbi:uncharacterized protein LOC142541913 [Primulina tabacum]|uniref:uncharacterized protein LOC142541913 n=1 Tax=Primulina tabacum TaxID=48773 RepID=UPI003F590429
MEGGGEIPVDEIPLARGRGRGRGRPRVRVVDDTFVEQAADQLEHFRMDELVARFHSMHPPGFNGSDGAEKAELWVSEIEELFDLIEYPPECRLRLAVHQLKDRAKMWWSTTLMTLDAQRIIPSWDIFKLKFKESYCPPSFYSSKASEFHNLKQGDMSVAEYADSFYAMLRYAPHVAASQVAVVEMEIAKKAEASLKRSGNRAPTQHYQSGRQQFSSSGSASLHPRGKQFKKPGSSSSSSGSSGNRGVYRYSGPYCDHCGGKHSSNQCVGVQGFCNVCGRPGHFARVCPSKTGKSSQAGSGAQSNRIPTASQSSHQPSRTSHQSRGQGGQQNQSSVHVFALTEDEAQAAPGTIITGNCTLCGFIARVLFDTGASHSFVSHAFVVSHDLRTTSMNSNLSVVTPMGKMIIIDNVVFNAVLFHDENVLYLNLIVLPMHDFDCIVGMDVLTANRATVDCYREIVRFRPSFAPKWNFYGRGSQTKIPLVSSIEMNRLLDSGHEGFLVYAVDLSQDERRISDIPVVREFPDVFPKENPGFPPEREVDFSIELMPGTEPISRAPYRLAPVELKELKEQLQDLLSKDYDCEIQYHPGKVNVIADALSRKVVDVNLSSIHVSKLQEDICTSELDFQIQGNVVCVSQISVEPELIQIVKSAQKTDDRVLKSYELVSQGHQYGFSIHSNDSLRLNGRLVVPDIPELRTAILKEAHCIRYSIHPGGRKMYLILRPQFWWKNMKKYVAEFVSRCMICQQVKAERMRSGGLLHSLEVPQWNWEHVAMDFVTHLPRTSRHFDVIWVIVDRLSKSAHFIPYERTYSYKKMARLGVVRFGMRGKLSPRFVGPYEIVERIGTCAYRLDLPQSLSGIHDVFHVSMLRKYEPDPSHVIQPDEVELDPSLSYTEYPVCILDRKDKVLRNKVIPLVRVQWSRHGVEESTWETEHKMRTSYPYLFDS